MPAEIEVWTAENPSLSQLVSFTIARGKVFLDRAMVCYY